MEKKLQRILRIRKKLPLNQLKFAEIQNFFVATFRPHGELFYIVLFLPPI